MIPRRQFYFLRHGQTDWNRDGRYQGIADTPLNETGVAQAYAAAAVLRSSNIDRIIVSPMVRALKTAAVVAEALNKPIHIERGIRERNFGRFDGLVIREVKAKHGVPPDQNSRSILPTDADPWEEIFQRVPPVIARWMADHASETLLFVAHGGVFDAIHAQLVGPRAGPESKYASPYLVAPISSGWQFKNLGD
jgi:broad specificity phosphatase PhoE